MAMTGPGRWRAQYS